ncbi:MAG UNVERIFIED_CONTAM: hypothetical protein LVQ98_07025 [Rickettsiaceae bacterium]|jgi:hypothetical protein
MHKLAMNTPDIVEQARLLKFSKELNAASIDVTTEEAIEYLTKCPSTLLFVDYYDGKKLAIGIRIKLYFGLDRNRLG